MIYPLNNVWRSHRRYRIAKCVMYLLIVVIIIVVIAFTRYFIRPQYPGHIRFACSYTSVALKVADSGRVKRYEWHPAPGRRLGYISSSRIAVDDIRRNGYPIEFVKLVRLANGDVKSPVWIEHRPARIYSLWERLTLPGRSYSSSVVLRIPWVPYSDLIKIPMDSRIRELILILKAEREDTGWRVLSLAGKDLEDAYRNGIFIPDLMTLPPLEASTHRNEYKDVWMTAEAELRREERLVYSQ